MNKTLKQNKQENEELKAALLESTRPITDVYVSWTLKGFTIYNVGGFRMQETLSKNRNLLRVTNNEV